MSAEIKPRAFTLELTKGCNLRCGYCYYAAREDAYDPRDSMSRAVAERAVDVLLEQARADEPIHVHLFGGEPLLNFELLRHVVEYGERRAAREARAITFELTTNGTLFTDRVIDYLNIHAIRVGVSFDGPPEIQDVSRPARHGSSHARAEPGIRRFLRSRAGTPLEPVTHCSVVVTRRDLDLIKIVEHLESLGFSRILITPATDLSGQSHGLRASDLPAILSAYDALADRVERARLDGRADSVVWFDTLWQRLLSGRRKTSFCGGGRDYLGVAADGDVSLCYRFYEDERYKMGNVVDGVERSAAVQEALAPLETRPACSTCWARYFCGGGCHHENLLTTGRLGDPNPVTCEILRHGMDRTLDAWGRLASAGRIPTRHAEPLETGATAETMESDTRTRFELEDKPHAKATCHVREIGAERVVYEPSVHEVVFLNATAAWIFERCDGTHTVRELAATMGEHFEAPDETLLRDLLATLAMFRTKGLLR